MVVSSFIQAQPGLVGELLSRGTAVFQELLPDWVPGRICLVGTGSSMNAMLAAASSFAQLPAYTSLSSPMEMLKQSEEIDPADTLAIVVSQSGDSIDTVSAAQRLLDMGAHVIAVTGNADSPLAELGLQVALMPVADEQIGPKTKGYVATVLTLQLLAIALRHGSVSIDAGDVTDRFSEYLLKADAWAEQYAQDLANADVVVVAGQGDQLGTAQEGSLKIAEMSGVPCFAAETEEYSHGRVHGLTASSRVIFVVNSDEEREFATRLQEALGQFQLTAHILDLGASSTAWVDSSSDISLSAVAAVVPLQLLAVRMAHLRGVDPTQMRYPTMGKFLKIKVSTAA